MNFFNVVKIAWQALLRNRTRAMLTMLGIVIGIGSVIAMVSIGQSSQANVSGEIAQMGPNTVMITRADQIRGGINVGAGSVKSLKDTDVAAILAGSSNITIATPVVSTSAQLVYGSNNRPGSISGGNEHYLEINKLEIASGANFTPADIRSSAKVCLIGQTVVDELFGEGADPLGKVIRMGKIPVKVVGVLVPKGQSMMGTDQDDQVIMPYTTVQKRMLAINYVHMISASATSEAVAEAAAADIEAILTRTHSIRAGAEPDFEVNTMKETLDMVNSITGTVTLMVGAIAAISLLVGGIGIMNIMYVTVTERTREIGLRMAVGAKNRTILRQFLFESTILSLLGGVVGMVLGVAIAWLATLVLVWPFTLNAGVIVGSFVVCAAIGMFFGWYPARKASMLDPITALRFE